MIGRLPPIVMCDLAHAYIHSVAPSRTPFPTLRQRTRSRLCPVQISPRQSPQSFAHRHRLQSIKILISTRLQRAIADVHDSLYMSTQATVGTRSQRRVAQSCRTTQKVRPLSELLRPTTDLLSHRDNALASPVTNLPQQHVSTQDLLGQQTWKETGDRSQAWQHRREASLSA